ncbi:CDP-glycerol glycerophosphotransferase family protein [Vibrio jasicida]|uniref:CDP-glycerol glycerophosphotransferase family protein n=1 Tax=Vibrio jasicida TaxID=766224 RepID=UPI0003AAF678|nr:CDP-glycerol glycerophosphotransferase family protein [Vibrio jasicida]
MSVILKLSYLIYYLIFPKKVNRVVFYSASGASFNQNSKHLFEFCIANTDLECKFVVNNNRLREQLNQEFGGGFISNQGVENIRWIMSAGIWVTSTGLPIKVPFFDVGRLCVNLWHGIPLKKVLYKDVSINALKRLLFSFVYPKYDIVTSTSDTVSDVLVDSFRCKPSSVVVTGQAWNDAVFTKDNAAQVRALDARITEQSKLVLYAPTWRNAPAKAFSLNPFKTYPDERPSTVFFPFEDLKLEELQSYLESEDIFVFVRAHLLDAQNNQEILKLPNVVSFEQDAFPDVMEYINAFDMLITDYSSIYFDFLHLDRPMLFLPYDIEEYTKNPGFNFDYHVVTPGPKPSSFAEFKTVLSNSLSGDFDRELLLSTKRKFHKFDGDNCKRIYELMKDYRDSK